MSGTVKRITGLLIAALLAVTTVSCGNLTEVREDTAASAQYDSVQEVPDYSGEPYVEINNNQPDFTEEELEPYRQAGRPGQMRGGGSLRR